MPVSKANILAENRAAAKRQAVITVSVVTLVFILWPERYLLWRNLCFVPVVAWLTSLVFDLKHGALDAWDGVPAWLKRFIGADDNNNVNSSPRESSRIGARQPKKQATTIPDYVLMHLLDTLSWIKSEAVRLWVVIGPIIGEMICQALDLLISQIPASQSPSKQAPEFTQYYGLLIRTSRIRNSPPPFASSLRMRDATERSFDPESKDLSAFPSVLSSWDANSRLSLCLVEKAIWEDRDLTLKRKLATVAYWRMTDQGQGSSRIGMNRDMVENIAAIDVIGPGDGQYDALEKSHNCYTLLVENWKYSRAYWDDVDFAIILAQLVLGPVASMKVVQLYQALCKSRTEQAQVSKGGAPNLDPLLIAAATGGLAAPFVLPLMAGGLAAAAMMKKRSGGMLEQRRKEYRSLMTQFPELRVLFEKEETEEGKSLNDEDSDEEWKDERDDYYNDAFSPFDW